MNFVQLKNSFRFLLKKKNYLLINVLGLGVGIASFLILFLYVYNDFTYNDFNKNMANIYRVREGKGVDTKGLLLPKMLEQIPEVENGTRIFTWAGFRMSHGETAFPENIQYVDTGFFSVFSFPFIEGSAYLGIHDKYGVVISKQFAEKYFGKTPAVGKKLQVKFENTFLTVNGVVDIPANSSVKFDIVTSYETGESISPWIKGVHDWYNTFSTTLESWQYPDLNAASQKFKLISEELEANPYIESVSFSRNIPGDYDENYNTFSTKEGSGSVNISLRKAYIGKNYFKTYGIKILNGTGFDQDLTTYKNCMVLNKTAMEKLGFAGATGQIMHENSGQDNKVIGEVDDFSYQGAQREMQPLAHFFTEQENLTGWNYLSVRAKPGASLQVIELLKKKWKETSPTATVNYFFTEDKLNEYYKEYVKVNQIVTWFSALAVILSCIGLFALSSYAMTRRTKEIGIRKVNGARVSEILTMLNKDFVKWMAIAFVIATPIAYYAMNKWLENFAYKTELSWWIFALAGLLALGIALLTVSFQSWKAATRNPVESLRYE